MMQSTVSGIGSSGGCDCCQLSMEDVQPDFGCTERRNIFTPREQEVLKRIREVGETARSLKKQIRDYGDAPRDPEAYRMAVEELESLRRERSELEKERVAAAEERMRYLGHA